MSGKTDQLKITIQTLYSCQCELLQLHASILHLTIIHFVTVGLECSYPIPQTMKNKNYLSDHL